MSSFIRPHHTGAVLFYCTVGNLNTCTSTDVRYCTTVPYSTESVPVHECTQCTSVLPVLDLVLVPVHVLDLVPVQAVGFPTVCGISTTGSTVQVQVQYELAYC